MTNDSDVILAQRLIKKDLLIDDELPETIGSLEELKKQLIPIINHLLDHDLNRLLIALYRNINEGKIKKILSTESPEGMADKIADLVIKREMQKVITRKKYSPN